MIFSRFSISSILSIALFSCPALAEEAISLFNGKDLSGWTNAQGGKPGEGWKVEDESLYLNGKGGDLYPEVEVADFELEWEWKISKAGNSGVKYRVGPWGEKGGILGFEYQILDDANHPDGKVGKHRQTASLYDYLPPSDDKKLKPVGEWNTSKVIARGKKIEHYLNGELVLEVDLDSPEFAAAKAKSKFKNDVRFGKDTLKGKIFFQDHQDPVWYRNIRLKKLSPASDN